MKFFNASSMLTLFAMNSRATVGTSDKCFNGLKKNRVPLIDNAVNSTSNHTLRSQSHALLEESSSSCPFGTHMITYSTTTLTSHSLIILIINIPVHYVRFIVRTTPIIYHNQQQQKVGEKDRGHMFVPFPSFNDNDDDDNYEEDNDDDYDKEEKSPDNCYCDDEVDDDDDDDYDNDDDDADYDDYIDGI